MNGVYDVANIEKIVGDGYKEATKQVTIVGASTELGAASVQVSVARELRG